MTTGVYMNILDIRYFQQETASGDEPGSTSSKTRVQSNGYGIILGNPKVKIIPNIP